MKIEEESCIEKCPFDKCIWKGEYEDKYYEGQKEKCYIKYFYKKREKIKGEE